MTLLNDLEKHLAINTAASILETIEHPLLEKHKLNLFLKRDDKLHPVISGNKWRKLKYIIAHALELGYTHIVSMGGAYSNHLHALAWIGKELGIKTTGLIRGEENSKGNHTIEGLKNWGMTCHFISRSEFRTLRNYREYNSKPAEEYSAYWIPEGGANQLALKGIAELVDDISEPFDEIILPCGTGTTLAGIAQALPDHTTALGFSALKGKRFLEQEINKLLSVKKENWRINHDYHFGAFAKTNEELLKFMNTFQRETGIPLEPVYTGKMLFGLFDLIQKNYFKPNYRIIAIHTGGLQGRIRIAHPKRT